MMRVYYALETLVFLFINLSNQIINNKNKKIKILILKMAAPLGVAPLHKHTTDNGIFHFFSDSNFQIFEYVNLQDIGCPPGECATPTSVVHLFFSFFGKKY
jgi:hypothetical protein